MLYSYEKEGNQRRGPRVKHIRGFLSEVENLLYARHMQNLSAAERRSWEPLTRGLAELRSIRYDLLGGFLYESFPYQVDPNYIPLPTGDPLDFRRRLLR